MNTIEKQLKNALSKILCALEKEDEGLESECDIGDAILTAKRVMHSYDDALIPFGILDQAIAAIDSMRFGEFNGGIPKRFVVATADEVRNRPFWARKAIIHETYIADSDEMSVRLLIPNNNYGDRQVFLLVPVELGN